MITSAQAQERALRQIVKDEDQSRAAVARTVLAVIANDALELMAKRVKDGPGYEGLQKDFTVTPIAGRIDLTIQAGILFDIDKSRVRVSSSNASVQLLDSYETLENGGLPADRIYAAQDGGELVFRDTSGSIVSYATAVKIKANYVPSFVIADALPIPTQYEGLLVSSMVEMALKADLPSVMAGEAKELAQTGRA